MKIFVVNAGSSSLKYQLIDMENEQVLAKGLCERIGVTGAISHKAADGRTYSAETAMPIRGFSKESVLCIRWPKYWSFSIHPSNEYSGLISFKIDWLDLLAVQGPLNSLLQHHSSKASTLQRSAFFMVQLSHPYMKHWKNHSFD